MIHRQDAFRALQKLGRGNYKVNQKAIKVSERNMGFNISCFHLIFFTKVLFLFISEQIAWALNKGIKSEFKQYWDVDLGVTYIPWSKIKEDQLEEVKEGGILDVDTLSPGTDTPQSDNSKLVSV